MFTPLIILSLWIGLPTSIYGTVYHLNLPKIVSGERAPAIYPYQISLQARPNDDNYDSEHDEYNWEHFCGGSIVTERHIVTAAHCLTGSNASILSIWAGSTKLNGYGQRYLVENFTIHPNFVHDVNQATSDIGIITIHGSFKFNENIRPIEYSAEVVGDGAESIVTGWGATKDLQRFKAITISNEKCSDFWTDVQINNAYICTEQQFGTGNCQGDWGGPLAKDNQLIGVAPFGHIYCGFKVPDVYTRVSTYYQWIKDNTKDGIPAVVSVEEMDMITAYAEQEIVTEMNPEHPVYITHAKVSSALLNVAAAIRESNELFRNIIVRIVQLTSELSDDIRTNQ